MGSAWPSVSLGRIAPDTSARNDRNAASGADSRTTTVTSSGVSIEAIPAAAVYSLAEWAGSAMYSREALTSALVRALPSWNVRPGRRWKVKVCAASSSHEEASAGTTSPVASYCTSPRCRTALRIMDADP